MDDGDILKDKIQKIEETVDKVVSNIREGELQNESVEAAQRFGEAVGKVSEAASEASAELGGKLSSAADVLAQAIPVQKPTKNRRWKRADIAKNRKRGRGYTKPLVKSKRRKRR